MRADEILGVGAVRFIEPSFADLTDSHFTSVLASFPGDQARLLIDEQEDPLALAFHNDGVWNVGTFLCRKPSAAAIERFEEVNGEIYQEDRVVWAAAVREYFSRDIADNVTPALDDLNKDRPAIIEDLVMKFWSSGAGETCLDFCCGSGVGSQVLRNLGYSLLSCDNDPSLISLGLSTQRLLPEETICINATIASDYLDPVPRGIGIMMGDINLLSQELWQQLVSELFSLTEETLITVGTEPEAELIRRWGEEQERTVEVHENPKDPIYDRWVCIAQRE
ncbi:MAG: hypothetical protein OS112_10120 [Methanoregula sp.]|nr:MAG: hypothetical protein OS112_10120 [Methanoregula sp.]